MADIELDNLIIRDFKTSAGFQAAVESGEIGENDLNFTPFMPASIPLLTPMWLDHEANDMSWLRADTFSWQSGDVYKAAYEHLVNDLDSVLDDTYTEFFSCEGILYYRDPSKDGTGDSAYPGAWSTKNGTTLYHSNTSNYIAQGESLWGTDGFLHPISWSYFGGARADTIGDFTIAYYQAVDGHKICLPEQADRIADLYNQTGVAWYYLLDTTYNRFKLPRTKYGFTGLRDFVGGYVAPGLPNIKDSMQLIGSSGSGFYGDTTGALYASGSATTQFAHYSGGEARTHINIDASRSSAIYGASDTVQPAATQMYLYFYVGHFEQDAVEQTAGLNAETFNRKADRDLMNTAGNVDFVIESQLPTADNGYTWYRKYKSGWVEQGGYKEISTGSSATISLPISMVNTNYSAQMTPASNAGGASPRISIIKSNLTTTTITLNWYSYNDGQAKAYWQVSGMSAQ